MKKKGIVVLVLGLVFGLVVSSALAAEYKEIRYGLSTVMTGEGTSWSNPNRQGMVMHIEEINAAGGLTIGGEKYKFKLCAEDNKFTVAGAVAAMDKLVYKDKVHVLYTFGGAPFLATQERLEKIPMLSFCMSWDLKFRSVKYPYTYIVGMITNDFGEEFITWVKNHYNVKTLVYLAQNNQTGRQQEPQVIRCTATAGLVWLKPEYYERGTTNFYSVISRLSALKPDVVLINMPGRDTGLLLKQRDELGAKLLIAQYGPSPPELMRIAPKECERDYVMRHLAPSVTPKYKAYWDRYVKRWKEDPDWSSQEGYETIAVYAQAVEKAGSLDPKAVKAALDDPNFVYEGLLGTYRWGGKSLYGRNCNMYFPIGISVIKDGKVKFIELVPVKMK